MSELPRCKKCHKAMVLPPSLEDLQAHYPKVIPSLIIDRTIPRCWICDYKLANKKAMDAEFPTPDHVNLVAKIEKDIETTHKLISEGADLEDLLPIMWNKWENTRRERDLVIAQAWGEFRAIWGSEDDTPLIS